MGWVKDKGGSVVQKLAQGGKVEEYKKIADDDNDDGGGKTPILPSPRPPGGMYKKGGKASGISVTKKNYDKHGVYIGPGSNRYFDKETGRYLKLEEKKKAKNK